MNLWRVPATGGPPRPVAGVSAIAYDPSVSRKGNFLAYEHANLSAGIWRIKLTRQNTFVGSSNPDYGGQIDDQWAAQFLLTGTRLCLSLIGWDFRMSGIARVTDPIAHN